MAVINVAWVLCCAVALATMPQTLASWPNLPEQTVVLRAEGARGRALQQQTCTCINPGLQCPSTLLGCVAGATVVNAGRLANCSAVRTSSSLLKILGSSCSAALTVQSSADTFVCPTHNAGISIRVCTSGLPMNGANPTSCTSCQNVTFQGRCDTGSNGNPITSTDTPGFARTQISGCPGLTAATAIPCTDGQEVDLSTLGCTLTNRATPQSPGTTPFFFAVGGSRFSGPRLDDFYIDIAKNNQPLPTKITCSANQAAVTCKYTISALPGSLCFNKGSSVTNIYVGSGPIVDGFKDDRCPFPDGA